MTTLRAAGRQALGVSPWAAHSQAGFRTELVASTGEAVSEELGWTGPWHCWGWKAGALPGWR